MPFDDRDREFERALHRHLSGEGQFADCPDADTLGAFHEGTLSPEEMAHWKTHITACERCQEALYLLQGTEALEISQEQTRLLSRNVPWKAVQEDAQIPAESMAIPAMVERVAAPRSPKKAPVEMREESLRGRQRSWLSPALGIAAMVVIGFAIYAYRAGSPTASKTTEIAEYRAPAAPPTATQKEAAPSPEQREELSSRKKEMQQQSAARSVQSETERKGEAQFSEVRPSTGASKGQAADISSAAKTSVVAGTEPGVAVEGPRVDAMSNAMANAMKSANTSASAPARPPAKQAAPAPLSSPGEVAEGVAVQNRGVVSNIAAGGEETKPDSAAKSKARKAESLSYGNVQAKGISMLRTLANTDPHYIVAPGDESGWRVGGSGSVEYTANGGKTWVKQVSGVNVELTSGSAPSARVVWVVGQAGTILRTIDGGEMWKRVVSPLADDLGGVHAADELHASIWSRNNRLSYQTSDGGVTWTRTANE